MAQLSLLPLPLLFFVLLLSKRALAALVNVSIDDTSPLITYIGTWEPDLAHLSSLDFGGAHTVSTDRNASAVLSFTGVAVYFLAPRWPYTVTTKLTLDDASVFIVDLTDQDSVPATGTTESESAPWSIVWSATGLTNSTHTVVVSMDNDFDAGSESEQFIVVDGFLITTSTSDADEPASPSLYSESSTPTYTSVPSPSSPAPSPSPLSSSPTSRLRIIRGLIFASKIFGGVLIVLGAIRLCYLLGTRTLRQRDREREAIIARRRKLQLQRAGAGAGREQELEHDPFTRRGSDGSASASSQATLVSHENINKDKDVGRLHRQVPVPVLLAPPPPRSTRSQLNTTSIV